MLEETQNLGLDYRIVIPARLRSSRLPQKLLRDIHGKPLIAHVVAAAKQSDAAEVIVATDHRDIAEVCADLNISVLMTSDQHQSGSDRLAEVVAIMGWADEQIVVNLQGDEPLMPAENLQCVAQLLQQHPHASISTLHKALSLDEAQNPNVVKLVQARDARVLYFSRSILPFDRDANPEPQAFKGHIGLYAYRAGFLKQFSSLEMSPLEQREKLEQLRALWHGFQIVSSEAPQKPGPGVDTEADLERVKQLIQP